MLNLKPYVSPKAIQLIPAEMAATGKFHNWKFYTPQGGKAQKTPVKADGALVGYNDPNLPKPLQYALNKSYATGWGLGITLGNGLTLSCDGQLGYLWCIDYDGFAEIGGTGVDDGVNEQLELSDSYTEISQSLTGFKVYFVSDKPPATKSKYLFSPSMFYAAHPEIEKYQNRAIEVFSKNTFLALTGDRFSNTAYTQLRFIPEAELDLILEGLNCYALESGGSGRQGAKAPEESSHASVEAGGGTYAKLTQDSLELVLTEIDPDGEQSWSDVANALARAYGEDARAVYHKYSARSDKYDKATVDTRYDRALKELASHPSGYGVKHLIELAKAAPTWQNQPLKYEGEGTGLITPQPNGSTVSNYAKGITAAELSAKVFQPLMWIVDGILPEGCYLLSARPKVGKSWMALQISLAVAFGTPTLGRPVVKGKAIYLALEENQRRLQDRLKLLRPQGYATSNLHLFTQWPAFDNGGLEKLIDLIHEHKPKLLVIDTLAKVRPASRNNHVYENDYKALAPLTTIAGTYRCCIVIVTHNRKGKAESDVIEQVSGSLGLMGAVDGALIIDGVRTDQQYKLSLVGRDIPNDDQLAISRQPNGEWHVLGNAKEVYMSDERKAITDLLASHPTGLRPKDVADLLGKTAVAARKLMLTMAFDSQLVSDNKGNYTLPANSSNGGMGGICSNSGNTGNSTGNTETGVT